MIPSVSAAPQMPSAGRINPSGPIQLDCDVLFSGAIRATANGVIVTFILTFILTTWHCYSLVVGELLGRLFQHLV